MTEATTNCPFDLVATEHQRAACELIIPAEPSDASE
jgi:hypothetical protein